MRKRSLQSRVLLTVLFSVLFMIVASISIGMHFFRADLDRKLQEKGQILAELQAQALSDPLWSLDEESVHRLLQDLTKDGDFIHAVVVDPSGDVAYSYGSKLLDNSRVMKVEADISHVEHGHIHVLGTLQLTFSYNQRDAAFKTMLLVIGGITIAVLGVVLGVIYGAFRQLTVPLGRMTDCMYALAGGNMNIDIPDHDRDDEIGRMAQALQVFKENAVNVREMENREAEIEARNIRERRVALDTLVDSFEHSISSVVEIVSASALVLTQFAQDMTVTAENSSHLSAMAAMASEEASANIRAISQSAEELAISTRGLKERIDEVFQIMDGALQKVEACPNSHAEIKQEIVEELHKVKDTIFAHADACQKQYEAAFKISHKITTVFESVAGVSESVSSVKFVAKEAGDAATQIHVAAADLNVQADILQIEASAFLKRIRGY